MAELTDPALVAFCGSVARARTLGALANAVAPMTGYRVAKVSGVPEPKVYPELRRALRAGIVRKEGKGFRLIDEDLRFLLQKRVRLYWDVDWDQARAGWSRETPKLLKQGMLAIRQRIQEDPFYLRPKGWVAPPSARDLDQQLLRSPEKDALIQRRGGRTSKREDWVS
jgi:hypothetical protein